MLIGIDGNEANINDRVGSNTYAYELIRGLEQLDYKNEYLIYLREKPLPDMPTYRSHFAYKVIPPKPLWTQWRLPIELYFGKPRPKVFLTPGHYAPRFSPIPTVISILDLSFIKYPGSFQPAVLHQLLTWTKRSANQASHILTISESSKSDIIHYYGIAPDKITVTYPGINPRFTQKPTPAQIEHIKQKYHIGHKYLLALGTKQPKKNLPRLIEAFQSLSLPNLSLVIVGKTWHQFQNSDFNIQNSPNIMELGYVPDADLPAIYAGATAFVLSSLYEGFGIPVAEAMTVGVPVVVSNTSSLPEVAGDAGIYVDPHSSDSIANGLKLAVSMSPEKRLQLVKAGQSQAKKYSWVKCARQTLEVLDAVALH